LPKLTGVALADGGDYYRQKCAYLLGAAPYKKLRIHNLGKIDGSECGVGLKAGEEIVGAALLFYGFGGGETVLADLFVEGLSFAAGADGGQ
jgi:hypothetical protein